MKKIVFYSILFLNLTFAIAQQRPSKLWDARFGGSDTDMGSKIIETSDHNYLICGTTSSGISGDKSEDKKGQTGFTDFWVVKMNALGQKIWDKTYGGRYTDLCRTMIETHDGGFLIGGYSESDISGDKSQTGNGGKDYWVIKIKADGTKEWDASFGGSRDEDLYSIVETPTGDFLLGGTSDSRISGDKTEENRDLNALRTDYWVIKISSTGTKIWDKTYGSNSHDQLRKIVPVATGGYLLIGTTYSNAGGEKSDYLRGDYNYGAADFWVIKIGNDGSKKWDKSYGGSGLDDAKTGIQTSDGGYLIAGGSRSPISFEKTDSCRGSNDSWLVKIDSLGTLIWDKTFGGDGEETVDEILQSFDGSYYFATSSGSNVIGEKSQPKMGWFDYWLVKVNSNGDKIWDGTYGGDDGDYCYTLSQGSDNSIILGGQSSSPISGHKSQASRGTIDYWVIKLLNNEITFNTPNDTLCLGSDVTINYNVRGIFNSGNKAYIQLSNNAGSFSTPRNLDTLTIEGSGVFTGSTTIAIPSDLPVGNQYKLRIITTNPKDTVYSSMLVVRNCCDVFGTPNAINHTGELYNTSNCEGETIALEATLVAGASHYAWTGPNGFTSSERTPVISNITSNHSGYYVVYAYNGSCTSEKDSVEVTVKSKPITPTISNDGPYTTGQTIHLSTTTTAVNYEWTGVYPFSSETQNPTINNATIAMAGTYNLRINDGNCWSDRVSTVVVVDGVAKIEEATIEVFQVFPNPISNQQELHIQLPKNESSSIEVNIKLMDATGKCVFESLYKNTNQIIVNLPSLTKGMYQLCLTNEFSSTTQSISVE
jgi:hypothetical protein